MFCGKVRHAHTLANLSLHQTFRSRSAAASAAKAIMRVWKAK
jgi:hypothetical protein